MSANARRPLDGPSPFDGKPPPKMPRIALAKPTPAFSKSKFVRVHASGDVVRLTCPCIKDGPSGAHWGRNLVRSTPGWLGDSSGNTQLTLLDDIRSRDTPVISEGSCLRNRDRCSHAVRLSLGHLQPEHRRTMQNLDWVSLMPSNGDVR
jgi:hypothetical protein